MSSCVYSNVLMVVRTAVAARVAKQLQTLQLPLLLLMLLLVSTGARAAAPEIPLAGKSFGLSATVDISERYGAGTPDSIRRYQLEELHSGWQLRSKIRYRVLESSRAPSELPPEARGSGTFLADHERLLIVNEAVGFCGTPAKGLAAMDFVDQLLTGGMLKDFGREKHVIGAARLLLFVHEHREQFERQPELAVAGELCEKPVTSMFTGTLGDAARVELYYAKSEPNNLTEAGIPRLIVIRRTALQVTGDSEQVLRYTFRRFNELQPAGRPLYGPLEASTRSGAAQSYLSSASEYDQQGEPLAFDVFAIPRAMGCARLLQATDQRQLRPAELELGRKSPRGFTLTARMQLQAAPGVSKLTVGYEAALATLKVRRVSATRITEMTTNFQQNRCYYSVSRRQGAHEDILLDKILQVGARTTGNEANKRKATLETSSMCAVTRASPVKLRGEPKPESSGAEWPAIPHTQGHLLLGTTELVYLGMARVRGIEVNVYESHDCQLPVWLQAPAVYRDARGGGGGGGGGNDNDNEDLHWHARAAEGEQAPWVLTGVFYFKRNGRLSGDLLLIEMFESQRALAASPFASGRRSITIPIYNFAWRHGDRAAQAQALAPTGERLEDFYSLGDTCLAAPSRASNNYARLDLLLEQLGNSTGAPGPPSGHWLEDSGKRSLALMRALQEQLGVPAQFAHDLSSRFEGNSLGRLRLSTRLAERESSRANLILLGTGKRPGPEILAKFKPFLAFSFQACYLNCALKRGRDSTGALFLFDLEKSLCYLYEGEQEGGALPPDYATIWETLTQNSTQTAGAPWEAYKIVHREGDFGHDEPQASGRGYLGRLRERLANTGGLYLSDPSLEPPVRGAASPTGAAGEEWAPPRSNFKVVALNLEQVDEKRAVAALSERTQQFGSDSSKTPGIGLVASDAQSRAVYGQWVRRDASPNSHETPSQMTFEQCRAACLAAAECRAYSTCVLKGVIECLLTSVDFKSAGLVSQLTLILNGKRSPPGTVFVLDLNSELATKSAGAPQIVHQVRVKRHPSCELHSKSYGHLFTKAGPVSLGLTGRILRPVVDSDQCARLCFTATWDYLRQLEKEEEEKTERADGRLLEQPADGPAAWAREHRKHICGQFFYLDLDNAKRLAGGPRAFAELGAQIQGSNFEGPTQGYCTGVDTPEALAEAKAAAAGPSRNVTKRALQAHRFDLDFLGLYEASRGLSLSESPKSPLERAAYGQASHRRALTPDESRALREFLGRGENSGHSQLAASAAQCAAQCFQQLTGPTPWPACRSFGFLEVWHTNLGKRYSFCLYNSISLRQARARARLDLVRETAETQTRIGVLPSEQVILWHYDPKPGLISSSLDQVQRVGLERSAAMLSQSGQFEPNLAGLLLALALPLVLGLALGVHIAKVQLDRKRALQAGADDSDRLVAGGRQRRDTQVVFENAYHRAD